MHWSKQHTSSSAKRSALCQMMPLSWVAALDFTFQQASYAKFILGHALASGSHCKSIPVKYPVCYQTSCNGNYFVPPEFPDDNEVVERSKVPSRIPYSTHSLCWFFVLVVAIFVALSYMILFHWKVKDLNLDLKVGRTSMDLWRGLTLRFRLGHYWRPIRCFPLHVHEDLHHIYRYQLGQT